MDKKFVYAVIVSGTEWGEDITPFISDNKVFKTRAMALGKALLEADEFEKKNPDATMKNYSTEVVVSSNNAGTTISYEIEELELVED